MNPIALAIPLFFVAIALELAVAHARGQRVYRFGDAITDLSCGVLQQVTVQWLGFLHGPYVWLAERALVELPPVAEHAVAFFGVDCAYYWWHRFTHESNLGWGTHVVHHQSEDYNLAVALRQSVTSTITSWPFYLPLALVGVSPEVGLLHVALNTLYQFWIHTELVGRLGPLELVLNTPSHHRVHHAVNPRYVDRNYAGVLIIWDRMFGSFEPESEPPVYGTVEPFASVDPLYANVWWFRQLAHDLVRAPNLREALTLLVARPSYRPSTLPPHPAPVPIRPGERAKYDPQPFRGLTAWIVVQFVAVALGVELLLLTEHDAPVVAAALTTALVAWTVATWGAWFERRPWVLVGDPARAMLLGGTLAAWGQSPVSAAVIAVAAGVAALGFALGPGYAALVAEAEPT